jgi:hypothetical protein
MISHKYKSNMLYCLESMGICKTERQKRPQQLLQISDLVSCTVKTVNTINIIIIPGKINNKKHKINLYRIVTITQVRND